ncbi:serine hydrolase domain-containing protein [Kribbella sp. NPDC003505]|uniref:serine hydrolase domain-containing protein n=1 Tax=Kribbella sp. NPDC003505 TaxID=3154448 RepID=UPI0033BCF472
MSSPLRTRDAAEAAGPGAPLPRNTPAAEGVDARGIKRFLDAVEASPALQPRSLAILRHGRVIASGCWAPYRADGPYMIYSLSKSLTSTALGLAVDEGLLRLDDRVVGFFPELDVDDPRTRSMRVRDLAAMSTGHRAEMWRAAFEADPVEPVRGFLRLPPDQDPGTLFAYNQPATYTLATILQRVTGSTLTEYLRPRLLEPIGAGAVSWQQYPAGRDVGFLGAFTTSDTILRLGALYLQRGLWGGRRVLPESWVAQATSRQVSTENEPHPDWRQGYGFGFWMSRHGFRGDGAYGQYSLVLPEQNAVVAYTGATVEMQSVLNLAWRHLLPAFDGAGSQSDDDELMRRLETLSLPPVAAEPGAPTGPQRWSATFAAAEGRCAAQHSLTGIEVVGGDEPEVVLREAGTSLRLRLGQGRWIVSDPSAGSGEPAVPVAVSGGPADAATLRFEALFLETPHRLVVTCNRNTGTFDATWSTPPLQPLELRDLHAPRASKATPVEPRS